MIEAQYALEEEINQTKPQLIEDYFVWNKRSCIKIRTGPTIYFVVDYKKNICETVQISEDKESGEKCESRKTKLAFFSISDLVEYMPIRELKSAPMFSFKIHTMNGSDKINPGSLDEIMES